MYIVIQAKQSIRSSGTASIGHDPNMLMVYIR